MAQRTEKEETEFEVVPETISLCVKCGGVAGNSATNNFCQKCSNATAACTSTAAAAGAAAVGVRPLDHVVVEKTFRSVRSSPDRYSPAETNRFLNRESSPTTDAAPPMKREVNRCSGCRRKVGLTGFRCRCGELFCADHRYSDRHDCSYDYKAAGRESIARENPVVKAAKIVKI